MDDRWFRLGDHCRYHAKDRLTPLANLITNKHKKQLHGERPNKFQKQQASRRIRKTQFDDSVDRPLAGGNADKHSKRKRSGNCPICIAKLERNNRMTRYVRKCSSCHAQFDPDLTCMRCNTNRVWRGKSECRCKGCGNIVE